jgi:glycosyltransferase involved in cell wall biosynthesis
LNSVVEVLDIATSSAKPASERAAGSIDVSVVIPCLDEADTIGICVRKARDAMARGGFAGEVIVVDNGSTDRSAQLAAAEGAVVVHERRRGYGNAYRAGFSAARGRFIVMGDGDDTYDFDLVDRFIEPLASGADLVMGSRLKGQIHKGAMPALHRYVGNPLLTGILNLFYGSGVSDAHCGMRAFTREALDRLDLRMPGMEFASEMVIRASKAGLRIAEIPIEYRPRQGESKLRSFRDGWRHLRFLLVHSPTHLFIIPGLVLLLIGGLAMVASMMDINVFGRVWSLHAMIASAMAVIAGAQVIGLGLAARAYGVRHLGEEDPLFERLDGRIRLEHGLLIGSVFLVAGLSIAAAVLITWVQRGFGAISDEKLAILALTFLAVGIQLVFSSFLLSIIGLRRAS